MAALQTLKKPSMASVPNASNNGAYFKKTGFNGLCNKRGRGFHGGQGGRPLRNVSDVVCFCSSNYKLVIFRASLSTEQGTAI